MTRQSKNIEAVYPLSHMQSGILFHTLYEPETSVYFEQFRCMFRGNFAACHFRRAWETVVARHASLRTLFVWEKRKKPLQAVRRKVALPWTEMDWSGLPEPTRQNLFEAFLAADRKQRFELGKAPLMRFVLIRWDDNRYAFTWSHHHILLDGWSMTNLFKEVFACYQAFALGNKPRLPPPRPYRDYIQWLHSQNHSEAESFWRETLAGFTTPNRLGVNGSPTGEGSYRKLQRRHSSASSTTIARFARQHRLTWNTLAHAAWSLLIHHYDAGATDVLFGSTVSGRPAELAGVTEMVGLFINTLPVRVRVSPNMPLVGWLQDLQNHLAVGGDYHFTSLVDIQTWSGVSRGVPLFESLFVFQNQPMERSLEQREPKVEELHLYEQTNYPIMIEVFPIEEWILAISYREHSFTAEQIERMLDHFDNLILSLASGKAHCLGELRMMPENEREQLLFAWNQTDSIFPRDHCYPQLFQDQVQQTPDRLVTSSSAGLATYRHINERANALAQRLLKAGTGPESIVALLAERDLSYFIAMLAIFKVGGTYLPLDLHHPPQRITAILAQSRPVCILVAPHLENLLEKALKPLSHDLAVFSTSMVGSVATDPRPRCTPDRLAYIIFTSGTTGVPKGVMIHHQGMLNHLYAKISDLDIREEDLLAQNAPQIFDISLWQFLAAPLTGGRIHIFTEEGSRDPSYLAATVERIQLTLLELVPSMLRMVLEEIGVSERPPEFKKLRYLILTGEALPPELCTRWLGRYPSIPIVNAYGPTECSDDITHHVLREKPETSTTAIPVGKAVANTQLFVLGRRMEPVPAGAFGECFAGGVGVGRGYLGRPARTAAAFVPHPFSPKPGLRLYKTGDRVRYGSQTGDPSPALTFHGRLDDQVKIRGFRIETGEIERVIKKGESIGEVLVVAREDRPGDQKLIAYLTLKGPMDLEANGGSSNRSNAATEPRSLVAAELPEYMMPAAFVTLDRFPLTPNGKIDRNRLPQPDFSASQQQYVPPRSPNEHTLTRIWAEALHMERVGIYDNFFELGGHSLIATQVIARIRNSLQVDLPLREIFAFPVLVDLSLRVLELRKGRTQEAQPIRRVSRDQPLPLSFIQQQLWFIYRMEPNNPAYNVTRPVRIKGFIDLAAVNIAFQGLVNRHEILRTVFYTIEGSPYQRVLDRGFKEIVLEDFSHFPESSHQAIIQQITREESSHIFDLSLGPLYYARILRFGKADHLLLINLHHIVSDGWSREIMSRDGGELYRATVTGEKSKLEDLDIQFADYAFWQRNREKVLTRQLEYWSSKLHGSQSLDLPLDFPRPNAFRLSAKTVPYELPKDLVDSCKQLAKSQGVTPFMFMLAAFNILLSRYSGQDDILVGSPVANRNYQEVENLIGFFVNTQVLRARLVNNPRFLQLLGQVRETMLSAYDNQELPFDYLVQKLNPTREIRRNPLFQVVFLYEPDAIQDWGINNLQFSYLPSAGEAAKLDITWQLMEKKDGNGLTLLVEFDKDIFATNTIRHMQRHFMRLLEGILENPRARVHNLPILGKEDHEGLLDRLNNTREDYGPFRPAQCMFQEKAAQFPDTIALVWDRRSLTYRALDLHVRLLAERLRGAGVAQETRVGIYLERSLEMAVGLLAVLMAGGAYVPLEPTEPVRRLKYMAEDARLTLILTETSLSKDQPDLGYDTLAVDSVLALSQKGATATPSPPILPAHAAYMIYTSGSTGYPKGVVNSHRAILNRIQWMLGAFCMSREDRFLQKTPFQFDVSVWEFLVPLTCGARLVIATPGGHTDPEYLARTIQNCAVTIIHFVPSMLRAFLNTKKLPPLDSLKLAFCSGEALSIDLVDAFHNRFSSTELHNLYGPTEAAVEVTHWRCRPGGVANKVPIGQPIANTRAYILDRFGRLSPLSVPGELHIGGVPPARGYWERPRLTAQQFIPDAFAAEPGIRLYRTGDSVRYLEDGEAMTIEFLGRLDQQIKIRGFRIELGEIENALLDHPQVREAAVSASLDSGDPRLSGYVISEATVADGEAKLSGLDLQSFLRTRLPGHMIPTAWVFLDRLPLTASGKLDYKALPRAASTQSQSSIPPRTDVERELAKIWCELLNLEGVGVHDNFFDLGGHSLMATRVVSQIRKRLNVEIPVPALFEHPEIASLARRIQTVKHDEGERHQLPIAPIPREGVLPLSFAQQRLWFIDQLEPGNPTYNIPSTVRISGPFQPQILEACLNRVVARHEALRSRFESRDGSPHQIILDALRIHPKLLDLRGLDSSLREVETTARARQEALTPFDLARGPLLRCTLLAQDNHESVLLFTMHHIVSDGWSSGVLIAELTTAYDALARGEEPRLPVLPIQYVDFAAWQQHRLNGPALEQQLSFWKQRLAGSLPMLLLPTDRPRPKTLSHRGGRHGFMLPAPLGSALRAFAGAEGATLYMVLLAAFKALLSRYSGQTDLLAGTPIANRNRAEIEGLIGFFVNTLVIRSDLSGNPSMRVLLSSVKANTLDAYANQDLPFEKLVEALQPDRDLARNPLFQVMFVYQNAPAAPLGESHLAFRPLDLDSGIAHFDLTLSLVEPPAGETVIRGSLEYRAALFDATTIARVASHYQNMLASLLAEPERPLSEHGFLGQGERWQLLVEWNDTRTNIGEGEPVPRLFKRRAERNPDAVALSYEGLFLSYAQLLKNANDLASQLRELGAEPGIPVGLFLERSPAMVTGIFGILAMGGAYLPLDPSLPFERLAYMLVDSGADILIAQAGTESQEPPIANQVYLAADGRSERATSTALFPSVSLDPEEAAYVLYTSGSTGKPKGTVVTHGGLANHMLWMAQAYPLAIGDKVFQKTPFGFDASVWEFFAPLLAGRELILAKPGGHREPAYLSREIQKFRISDLQVVPSLLRVLLEEPEFQNNNPLKRLFCGGELLTRNLRDRVYAQLDCDLINLYGPTETCIQCSAGMVDRKQVEISIGKPITNVRLYVLNSELSAVPMGVPGEIHVSGPGLARGYLGRPDMTAGAFIPDPLGSSLGARLYRTQDLGRFLANGTIEYLGRIDDQIKLRGYRLELGEIETELAGHPELKAAVVLVRNDPIGNPHLVAYLVGKSNFSGEIIPPQAATLAAFLEQRLPEYMIPKFFLYLDQFPQTASGKIDRRALPEPDWQRDLSEDGFSAPRNATETTLAEIWCEVLGLARVSIRDNFFELGGHSLIATRVVSQIRKRLTVEIPVRALFEAPTVAALAERVEAAFREKGRRAEPPLEPVSRNQVLPLSFSQQRLWFLEKLENLQGAYNMPFALKLYGHLSLIALEHSFSEVLRRHEALRTVFTDNQGQPRQVVTPAGSLTSPMVDLRELKANDIEAQISTLAKIDATHPFDLSRGPLLRLTLLRRKEGEHLLLANMHHISSDGWSIGVLVREWSEIYSSQVSSSRQRLAELPIQYADYAYWQRKWLQGEVLEAQLTYWKRQLAGAPALLELPTDLPRPALQSFRGGTLSFSLETSETTALYTLARKSRASLFIVLQTGFAFLLSRYANQEDVVIGTPLANRNRPEIEPLIGFFLNVLALRTNLAPSTSGNLTLDQLISRVLSTTLDAFSHADIPFERVVEAVAPERHLAHGPVFQVLFILQNAPMGELTLPGLSLGFQENEPSTTKYDLNLSLMERNDRIVGSCHYNADLFRPTTVQRLLRHYRNLLKQFTNLPQSPLSQVNFLDDAEKHLLVRAWNDSRSSGGDGLGLHHIFEERVVDAPEAIALIHGSRHITRLELNRRAESLSLQLRERGLSLEKVAGVCVERSINWGIALLAVLKTGAAYVSLDPSDPGTRLNLILEDAQAHLILAPENQKDRFPGFPSLSLGGFSHPKGFRPFPFTNRQLALLTYTSGSTGIPKGVPLEHRNVVNRLEWGWSRFPFKDHDTCCQKTGISFVGHVWETYGPLLRGIRLVLVPQSEVTDPVSFVGTLVAHDVTRLYLTPSFLGTLMEVFPDLSQRFARLQLWMVSGEPTEPEILQRFQVSMPGRRLLNIYGASETTADVTWHDLTHESAVRFIPLGRPIRNNTAFVLDPWGNPVALGSIGELYIGGLNLARCYYGRPDLTAQKFVPNPFCRLPGKDFTRLFATGDLALLRGDGSLDYVGRGDHQTKIRGFRIEPGEVESALVRHPVVNKAVVMPMVDPSGQTSLGALILPAKGRQLEAEKLKIFLSQFLPTYMIPVKFLFLADFPKKTNGKLDRCALQKILAADSSRVESEAKKKATPRNDLEKKIFDVWSQVLSRDDFGIHDDFFTLGGHSLQAMRLSSGLSAKLRIGVSVRTLFLHPTVAELALSITQNSPEKQPNSPPTGNAKGPEEKATVTRFPRNRHMRAESKPLLSLFSMGKVASIDAAAISCLPQLLLRGSNLTREQIVENYCNAMPLWTRAIATPWGRIGIINLPIFSDEIYENEEALCAHIVDAMRLAGHLGARTASLTGLIPSATNYGRNILKNTPHRSRLPALTTGHGTTAAAVILSLGRLLEESGRLMEREHLGFLGLGSIGRTCLRLLLKVMPHPYQITLCDLESKHDALQALFREIKEEHGYRGTLRILFSKREVPDAFYESTSILGATNVPEILDINQVQPGTLIVDDSAPHSFVTHHAVRRIVEEMDILVTEGGVLESPQPLDQLFYMPEALERLLFSGLKASKTEAEGEAGIRNITGCVFASTLAARFDHLHAKLGIPSVEDCVANYQKLKELDFRAAALHCEDFAIPESSIASFGNRFGAGVRI